MGVKRDTLDLYITPESYELIESVKILDGLDDEPISSWDDDAKSRTQEIFIALNNSAEVRVTSSDDTLELLVRRAKSDQTEEIRYISATAMRTEIDESIRNSLDKIAAHGTTMLLQCDCQKSRFRIAGNNNKRLIAVTFKTQLPQGEILSEAATKYSEAEVERTQRAIDLLEQEMSSNGVTFRALSCDSIIVDSKGLLYPIRYQNLRVRRDNNFEPKLQPKTQCDNLRTEFAALTKSSNSNAANFCGDFDQLPLGSYGDRFADKFQQHIAHGYPHEERVWVHDEAGYGFVNMENEYVVEPKYIWCGNFCEGRAIVQSEDGYGIIDTSGKEIIPATYSGICYDVENGFIYTKEGNKWAKHAYNGEQLTPFTDTRPETNANIYDI
ncbi:MAG: WG repeat-containing protein [Rikenellaceae bacterium]